MKPWHVVVVLLVVVLLFGAPKLPELARSLGKSMRILKEETKQLTADDSLPVSKDDDSSTDEARGN